MLKEVQEKLMIKYGYYYLLAKLDVTNLNESILDEPFNNLSVTVCVPLLESTPTKNVYFL